MSSSAGQVEIIVVSKKTAVSKYGMPSEFRLADASVVQVGVSRADVKEMVRTGNDLILKLHNGETITVHDFFAQLEGGQSHLVLNDDQEGLWLAAFGEGEGSLAYSYSNLYSIEPLLADADNAAIPLVLTWAAGMAALLAVGSGLGGSDSSPQTTKPDAPSVNPVNGVNLITGIAAPGSSVSVTFPDGTTVSAVAGEDGKFSVPNPGLKDGDKVSVVATDSSGGASDPTVVTVDAVAPAVPNVDPVNGKDEITGHAEPGSTVTVTFPDGTTETVTAGADGSFSVTNPGLEDGEKIVVTATDGSGNVSGEATATVDAVAPGVPTVDPINGKDPITGHAEPDSTIVVTYPDGTTDTVKTGPDGSFTLPNPGLEDGDKVIVTATDPSGNTSGEATVEVDAVAPGVPSVDPVTPDEPITGKAEPGSTVEVTFPDGTTETVTAGSDGSYEVPNPGGLTDGEIITVTATDPAGNTSGEANATVDGGAVEPEPGDMTPPSVANLILTVDPVTSDNVVNERESQGTVTLSGTIAGIPTDAVGTLVTVSLNATTYTAIVTGSTWRVDVPGAQLVADVDHKFQVTATLTDAAGNKGAKTTDQIYTVDTEAPAAGSLSGLVLTDDVGADVGPITAGETTDDATPTYSGTAAAGVATVELLDNGVVIGTATVNPDGTFSVAPETPLAGTDHVFTLRPVDAAGNAGAATGELAFTFDGVAPAAPAITGVVANNEAQPVPLQKDATTNDATPVLSGSGTAGTTVTIYDGATEVGSTTVQPDGSWSVEVNALGDGAHALTATTTNAAGAESAPTGAYPLNIDTQASAAPVISGVTDNVNNPGGGAVAITDGATTDDATPTLGGSGTPGETITILDNGNPIGETTVQPDGTWTFTPATGLGEGEHSLTTTSTDEAGNTSAPSPAIEFTVDTSALELAITAVQDNAQAAIQLLADGDTTNDSTPTFIGTASANAQVEIREGASVVGSTTADASGHWSITLPVQADGTHNYTVQATNAANSTVTQGYTLAVDTAASAAPAIAGATDDVGSEQGALASGDVTDDTTPTLSGSGTPGESVNIYVDGALVGTTTVQPDGSWEFTPDEQHQLTSDGEHTFTTTTVDAAGNESAPSEPFVVTLDTTAPDMSGVVLTVNPVTADNTVNASEAQGSVALTGTLSGVPADVTATTVEVSLNGTTYTAVVNGTSWSVDVPGQALTADADKTLQVTATLSDAAGNEGTKTAQQTYAVDTEAPAAGSLSGLVLTDDVGADVGPITAGETTDDATPTYSGTAAAGVATVELLDNGVVIGTATVNPDGTFSVAPETPLAGTDHVFTLRPVDAAGNAGAATGELAFTFDGVAPAAPAITDAVATLAQQTAGVDFAKAGYYPQIRVGMGTGTSNSSTGSTSLLASASASQMLYDFGKVDSQVGRSQALVRRQQATVLKQIDVISRGTAEAVLMVHRYQSLADIAQGQVDAVDRVLELAELRANAGLSTKADPIQARARSQGARAYLGQMSSELAQWRQKLRTFVGEVGARKVAVLPGLEHETLWMSESPEFGLLPDVLIVQAERQAAKAQLATTRASKWPTITLDATGNKAVKGVNPNTYERHGMYHSLQVNLSVPLYQGGAADAQISAAAAEEAATRERIETALLQAGDQSRAWRELAVGAQGRLADVEHRRQSILSVRDLYREQYQLGTRSILDLLNAEQEIHQAEAEAQGLVHDLWQYRLEYVAATGRLREFFGLNNKVVQGMELLP